MDEWDMSASRNRWREKEEERGIEYTYMALLSPPKPWPTRHLQFQ